MTTAATFALSGPAAADVVSPAGACVGSGSWKAGGFTKTSQQLTPDDIVEVPRADEVSWSGRVEGPAVGTSRNVAGRVALQLPPPLGAVDIADWGGAATEVQRSGTYAYDLPSLVPSGVVLDLLANHDEGGQRQCTAHLRVMVAGGPFDSPLIWVVLAGLLVSTGLLALLGWSAARAGLGRVVAGALMGLPFGLFVSLTLVLFGVMSMASPLVTTLLVLGPIVGAVWTRLSPFGAKAQKAAA
jgi:hypothetical protein